VAGERNAHKIRRVRDDEPLDDDVREDDASDDDGRDEARDGERPAQAAGTRRGLSHRPRMSAADAADAATRGIADLTAKSTMGAVSVEPAEDNWVVGVEVLEDHRVPSSADILALYRAEIDMDGTLLSYRRVQRYPRGQGNGAEGSVR
jgi:hypothetical protein